MKSNVVGVFTFGAMVGSAAALGVAAMDPAMRKRMCVKACHMKRACLKKAESLFR